MTGNRRIAILTGGGDCPGINAAIRAVAKKAIYEYGFDVIGIEDGYDGLIRGRHRRLGAAEVSGILPLGGTILGTSNTSDPFAYPAVERGRTVRRDVSKKAIANLKALRAEALICVGGDGTLTSAVRLQRAGVPVVGVPKTIDNDLRGTERTFGFDTAVSIATEAIDRIHSTAQSHHRVMIVEVMGRRAGWIALHAGIAGGGDIILIPEIPYDIGSIAAKIAARKKLGKRFSIVVVAEGARPKGGEAVVRKMIADSPDPVRLGGVGFVVGDEIEKATGTETRTVVLGHLQRGGTPTAYDRILATELGAAAVEEAVAGRFGRMAAVRNGRVTTVPLEKVLGGPRTVPPHHPLVEAARAVGTNFGD
jgi:phosphofructokinase-like protein